MAARSVAKVGIVVDGHHMAYRAYHRLGSLGFHDPKRQKWVASGVIYGVLRSLVKIVQDHPNANLGVVFDMPSDRRHAVWGQYKAGRGLKPPEFIEQLTDLKQALVIAGVPVFCYDGLEGDEVIGALVDALARSSYDRIVIWSSDRDFHQLLEGKRVVQWDPIRQITFTAKEIEETYGVPPKLFHVYRAFTGDVSDGIPPVRKGVGPVKAAEWVMKKRFPISDAEWNVLRRNVQLIRLPTLKDLERADVPTVFRERIMKNPDPLQRAIGISVIMTPEKLGETLHEKYRINAALLAPILNFAIQG